MAYEESAGGTSYKSGYLYSLHGIQRSTDEISCQSITQLEKQEPPKEKGFVAWVSPQEQRENLEAMHEWCTNLLLVREYVQEEKQARDPYEHVFSSVSRSRFFDSSSLFEKEPPKVVMMDNIHPTPFGHQILAEAIKEQILDWLP
jgi:hypothetical protein